MLAHQEWRASCPNSFVWDCRCLHTRDGELRVPILLFGIVGACTPGMESLVDKRWMNKRRAGKTILEG